MDTVGSTNERFALTHFSNVRAEANEAVAANES